MIPKSLDTRDDGEDELTVRLKFCTMLDELLKLETLPALPNDCADPAKALKDGAAPITIPIDRKIALMVSNNCWSGPCNACATRPARLFKPLTMF